MNTVEEVLANYQPVIGLEIHIQLQAESKVFGREAMGFGHAPNTLVSSLTYSHPGTLPWFNQACIDQMLKLGLALGCEINPASHFDRKNYFYPDLPKGYQITQDRAPLCQGGEIQFPQTDGTLASVSLDRIHLEEDAGKSLHEELATASLIDLNRAGTGLAELVTRPDLRSAEAAGAMLAEVRRIVRYLGVSDANMERGNLRCDANVSIMPVGSTRFGTRVEVKNLNSINYLIRAIKHEIVRQADLLDQGKTVRQETRLWDHGRQKTFPMRDKESVTDYRYFPEPDMPPIALSQEKIAKFKSEQPSLPAQRWRQYQEWGLPRNEALVIVEDRAWAEYFEAVSELSQDAKAASTWVLGPLRTMLKEQGLAIEQCPLSPQPIAQLMRLVKEGKLSFTLAKEQLLPLMMSQPQGDPESLAEQNGLLASTNSGELDQAMLALMEKHPAEVQRYKKGKKNLKGFFVGQLMRAFQGKADPKMVNQVVQQALDSK